MPGATGSYELVAASAGAGEALAGLEPGPGARAVRQGGRIRLVLDAADACLGYRMQLADTMRPGHWRCDLVRARDAVLLSPGRFLWLPRQVEDVAVEFRLPEGHAVSAPWQPLRPAQRGEVFRVATRSISDDAKAALGRLHRYRLDPDRARIEVAVVPGAPAVDHALIDRWLDANIQAVSAIHGRFPVPRLQLLVVPIGRGDESVPWGEVSRGGGDAVHL